MDARDSKSLRQEADVWMKQLDELKQDLDTRHDVQYGYLKEVIGQILKQTKDRATALLHELKNDRDLAKAQVAKLQSKLANGKRHGFESKEALDTLVDEIRKSVGEIPVNMMSLDPSAVLSAVESFLPTFTKCRPPPASVTAEVGLTAGPELQCRADAIITESAEFWAQVAPSAEVERELFNASLYCRLRHLAAGRNASFADRQEDVKSGLNCWAIIDGVYYRVIVENIRESLGRLPVEIRAVDFGLFHAVRYEDLIPFAEHDSLIPYQAHRFRLYGQFPTKLPRQARWAFADAVKDKWLTVKLHSLQKSSDTEYPLWEVTLTTDLTSGATVNDAVMEKAVCTTALPKVHASSDIRLLDPETAAAAGIQKVVTVLNKKETPTTEVTLENNDSPDVGSVSDMPLLLLDAAGGVTSAEPAAATESAGAETSNNAATTSEVAGVCISTARSICQYGIVAAPCYPSLGDAFLPLTRDVPVPATVDGIARDDSVSDISDIQLVGSAVCGRECGGIDKGEAGPGANLTGSRPSGIHAPSDAEQKPNASRNQQWTDGTSSLPGVTTDPAMLLCPYDLTATAAVAGALAAAEPALAVQSAAGSCVTHAEGCKPIDVPIPQPLVNLPSAGRVRAAFGHRADDSRAAGEQFGKRRGKDRATGRRLPQKFPSSPSRSLTACRTSHDNHAAAVVVSAFGDTAAESSADTSNVDGASCAGGTVHRSHPAHGEERSDGHFRPTKEYRAAGKRSTGHKGRNRKRNDEGRPLPGYPADRYHTSESPEVPHVTDVSVAVAATAAAADARVPGTAGTAPVGAMPTELQAHPPIVEHTGSSGGDSCPLVEPSCGDRGKAAAASEAEMPKAGGRIRPRLSGDSKAALQALLQPASSHRLRTKNSGATDSTSHDGSSTNDC